MHKLWLKVFALFLTTALLFASGCLDKDSKTDTGANAATPEAPEDLNGAENIKDASGRFLSLPFNDSEVEIVQGYFYTWDKVDNPTHMGIDYIKVDKNNSSWLHFDVLAAADGEAMQNEHEGIGLGKYVVIRHDETVNGMHYYSLYAHLDSVELSIPNRANWDANYDQWVRVSKGDSIGIAGDTGYPGYIHLHFEVFTGNTGSYQERTNNRVDPYDIKDYKNAYPQPPDVIAGSGDKHLWIVGSSRETVLGVQSQKPFTFGEAKRKEIVDFMEKATSHISEFLPEFYDPNNDIDNDEIIFLLIFNGITPSSWDASDGITRFTMEDVEWAAKTIFGPQINDIKHRSVGQAIWEESEQEYHVHAFGPTSFTETHVISIAEESDRYIVDVIHLLYDYGDYDRLDETDVYDEDGNKVVVLKGNESISEAHLRGLPVRRYFLTKTGDGGFYIAHSGKHQ